MDEDTEPTLSVGEFVDYCRIQAGLLSGDVEQMGQEADDLLTEIDEQVREIRARLERRRAETPGTETPSSAERPDSGAIDVEELESLQAELSKKQSLAEAKQARMEAFQRLAAQYTDLADELGSSVEDGPTALERVVDFEVDADAPAYFPERTTLCEAVAESATPDE